MRFKESNYLCNIKVQGKEAGDDVEATASDEESKIINEGGTSKKCVCLFVFQCRLKSLKGLPWLLSGKESTCQCRRHEFHPQSGRSSGGGNGIPLQY